MDAKIKIKITIMTTRSSRSEKPEECDIILHHFMPLFVDTGKGICYSNSHAR